MVANVSSVGRNGVHDFILIRVTAIILTLYTLYLVFFFAFGPEITFTLLALVSILIHAWIGLWQVLTDYIKPAVLRACLQFVIVTILFIYLFSVFFIVWGV